VTALAQSSVRDARWDELIAAEPAVDAALARKFGSLHPDKRAELIREAEIELIDRWERGDTAWPYSPAAWLVTAVANRACDHANKIKRRATDAAGLAGTDYESGAAPAAEADHERALAEENARGLYALLSPTQRHIAVLRFSAGLEPRVIAKQLRLSRRAVYRHLDAITTRLHGPAQELAAGEFPAAWEKLVCGHVAGTLSPRDSAKATALLKSNSDAQLFALGLQRAGEQLAALIPPTALLTPPETANPIARVAERVDDALTSAREALENSTVALKHQITNLFGRAAEAAPALASSPRSGLGPIIASCVVAGGGTVCAISGTTPAEFADIFGQKKPEVARKQHEREPARHGPATPPAPPPTRQPAPNKPPAASTAPPPAAPAPPPKPTASPAQQQFGIERPQPTAPASPAPAPQPGGDDGGTSQFGIER
jgi:RNA polymerase sigma factor (sigma-70 family)